MARWGNKEISKFTLLVWGGRFEKIAEDAKKGEELDSNGKTLMLKDIREFAEMCAKEVNEYR